MMMIGYLIFGIFLLGAVGWRVLQRARQQLAVIDLLPVLALVMLWVAPAVQYGIEESRGAFSNLPMQVSGSVYFATAIPGVLALVFAALVPGPFQWVHDREREILERALAGVARRWYWLPVAFGVLLVLSIWGHRLPEALRFPAYLLRSVSYVLGIVWLCGRSVGGWYRVGYGLLLLGILAAEALYSTMFGEMLTVGLVAVIYRIFQLRYPVWKMVVWLSFLFLLLSWLIAFKYDYRSFAKTNTDPAERVRAFARLGWARLWHPFAPESVDIITARLNQGANMSLALAHVPARQAFVRGETIREALWSTLVPRFLWPEKPKAGGVEKVRRFMGLGPLNYSINIGIVGEGYVNFGNGPGLVWFLIAYVWLFRGLYTLWVYLAGFFPVLILWLPVVFFTVTTVEKDLLTVLNHVVKSGIAIAGITVAVYGWGRYLVKRS